MVKKGKYKLFSYFIEDHLIFYKSLNKFQKFLAFSILEVSDFNPTFNILIDYLKKRFLNYFSVQLNNSGNHKILFILSFHDNEKDSILKIFHLLKQNLHDIGSEIKFLQDNNLKQDFFNIFTQGLNSEIEISKSSDSLILLNEKIPTVLQLYTINLSLIEKEDLFIPNFLRLLNDYNRNGSLVFNIFNDINKDLVLSTYLIEPRKVEKELVNFEKEINKFYGYILLEKQKLEIKHIWNLFWRIGPFNHNTSLKSVSKLFLHREEERFQNLSLLNSYLEETLSTNMINYRRINSNLLFINPKSLFFTFDALNFELILKILKKYTKKYIIYILVLNKKEYEELLKIDKLSYIENIRLMNSTDFINLDISALNKK